MAYVRSINNIKPPARYDGVAFTSYSFLESETEDGSYVAIDAGSITPQDSDPSRPAYRSFTSAAAQYDPGYYRIQWGDANGGVQLSSIIYIDDTAPSLVEELVRSEMPRTWDALARSPIYGEELLRTKIESVKYGILPTSLAAAAETSYAKPLLNYVAKCVARDLIPPAIEFWMREKITVSTTGTNETTSFADPITALRDLDKKLAIEIEQLKGNEDIAAALARPKELPAVDDAAEQVEGQITSNPYDWPEAFN